MKLKNKLKRAVAAVLTAAMALSMTVIPAFAEEESGECTITIDNTTKDATYSVYKIFDATYAVDGEDSPTGSVTYTLEANSIWVDLINDDSITITVDGTEKTGTSFFKLQAVYETGYDAESDPDSEHISYYVVQMPSDKWDADLTEWIRAAIVYGSSNSYTGGKSFTSVATGTGTGGTLKFTGLAAGYYYITTTVGTVVSVTSAAPDAVIIDKNQTPGDLKKVILDSDGEGVTAEADEMNEDVTFDITAHVPMYDGEKVVTEYIFNDTMSDGILIELTGDQFTEGTGENSGKYFLSDTMIDTWITLTDTNGDALEVKFSKAAYDYSVELLGHDTYTDATTGETLHTFTGFILTYYTYDVSALATAEDTGEDVSSVLQNSTYPTDAYIEIKYTAHTTSLEGYDNTNDIVMQWRLTSWKAPDPDNPEYPDYDGDGEPDGPNAGLTAHDDVYSWELELVKTDGTTKSPLKGATFTLESDDMKAVSVGHSYVYYLVLDFDEDGKTLDGQDITTFESTYYYKTGEGENAGWTTSVTDYGPYLRKLSDKQITVIDSETLAAEGTTDENGKLYFAGLGVGTYTLTEIKSPDGYNLLTDPIVFEISWTAADERAETEAKFTVSIISGLTDESGDPLAIDMTDGYILTLNIENNAGLRLPSTGGTGTYVFYAVGFILICGCAVFFIVRKRTQK